MALELQKLMGVSPVRRLTNFSGDADPENDAVVKSAKSMLDTYTNELNTLLTKDLPYWTTTVQTNINSDNQNCAQNNSTSEGYWACRNKWVAPQEAERKTKLEGINARIDELQNKLIPSQTLVYQQAKQQVIDQNIATLNEKAKTDPNALAQVTELNKAKIDADQAVADAKLKADQAASESSNKKTIIIASIAAGLIVVIAIVLVVLKKNKVVPAA